MRTVYVVSHTYWESSASDVRAVFETEEDAQEYIDMSAERRRCLHIKPVPMIAKGE